MPEEAKRTLPETGVRLLLRKRHSRVETGKLILRLLNSMESKIHTEKMVKEKFRFNHTCK